MSSNDELRDDATGTTTCELCGWIAAVVSMVAFGTFGVPIKSDAAKSVDVDPLVFQSYKTAMCFLTSWIILLMGEPFTYTPWGIVSGLFWVPGGTATVYAVKSAGLAIGVGVASSFIVLVSFTWGIFVFQESVESRVGACFAVFLMVAGIFGMAYYSSPNANEQRSVSVEPESLRSCQRNRGDPFYAGVPKDSFLDDDLALSPEESREHPENENSPTLSDCAVPQQSTSSHHEEELSDDSDSTDDPQRMVSETDLDHTNNVVFVVCGRGINRRTLGVLSAAFCGIWGGSIMVPMHFSGGETNGRGYLISFAIGASLVTIFLWVVRIIVSVVLQRSFSKGWKALPSFHLRKMWRPGGISGCLWSIGNFASLISVAHLGEGVGYSVVQASMLVAGLWGVFYFREIVGAGTIGRWFISASMTVAGILLLSYEHHEGSAAA